MEVINYIKSVDKIDSLYNNFRKWKLPNLEKSRVKRF